MRKIPTNENAGRSSPTLTPTTPTGSAPNILWAGGAGSKATTPVHSNAHFGPGQRDSANHSSSGSGTWAGGLSSANVSSLAGTGTPVAPTQDSNQFKYSREFILSLFDPTLPVPPDFEAAPTMTSDHPLEPLANTPLSDNEKKLFTSQSVNSEISARRTPYGRGESKDGVVRPPRAPATGQVQRGYSNRADRVGSQSDSHRPARRGDGQGGEEDPWDIPAGVGSFSGNGVFSRDDDPGSTRINKHDLNESSREDSLLVNRGRESPVRSASPASLDRRNASPTKGPRRAPSPAKPAPSGSAVPLNNGANGMSSAMSNSASQSRVGDEGSHTTQTRNAFGDMFNSFAASPLGTPLSLPTAPSTHKADLGLGLAKLSTDLNPPSMARSLSKGDLIQTPIQGSQPPPGIVAAVPFIPHKWQYKDPSGAVQGPFTAPQMQDWYRSGYFSDDLPIKRLDDYSYEPLARLLLTFGKDRPFLADMEESERRHAQIQAQEQQRRAAAAMQPGFRDAYPNEVSTPGGTIGYSPFGSFAGPGTPSLYTPTAINTDPFTNPGRDRFGTGGFDPLSAGGFARTSWGEAPAVSRGGWNGLNTELGSPFNRSAAAPGSPAGALQASYFDQRNQVPEPFNGGAVSQHRPTSFAPFSAPQSAHLPAPQSPAANLFSGQPILDFSAQRGQPAWGDLHGLVSGNQSHFSDDAHAPLDVVSRLIDESHFEHDEQPAHDVSNLVSPPAFEEASSRLSELSVAHKTEVANQTVKATPEPEVPVKVEREAEKATGRARKARKEERQERFERENESRREQNKQVPAPVDSSVEAKAAEPAVDLRSIISEQETRSKQDREQAAAEKSKQLREYEEAEQQNVAGTTAWASGAAEQPKLSLKQIQEIEQKRAAIEEQERQRRAHESMIQQAQLIQEQDALSSAQSWAKDQAGGPVWGSTPKPQPVRQKSLAEIMEEEEKRKRREAELRGAQIADVVLPSGSGGGKRYADTIQTVGNSSTIAWGLAAAGARPPNATRATAVVATGNVVKAGAPNARTDGVVDAWNVVGKQGQVVRPPAPVVRSAAPAAPPAAPTANRIVSVSQPSAPIQSHSDSGKGPSSGFMQWCRSALSPLARSTTAGVNVNDFIDILLSISIAEPAITQSICDDILGGLTAIDPRKFAEEFIRKRKADANGAAIAASESWTAVSGSAPAPATAASLDTFDSGNKFVVVGKQSKKKGKSSKK
ncbi:hypothetical protein HKX48_003709 [Thoreauomyces humboldtii]|nr:hypothetical protein HKX48_003709 [Thoreauomyces humboldtii]